MAVQLVEKFRALPRPTAAGNYVVEAGGETGCRVARSFNDHPVVLLSFAGASGSSAPRRLANISYTPPASVEIVGPDGAARSSRLAVLECASDDAELAAYFFRVVSSVLLDPASSADEDAFDRALDAIVTLFRALQRPGTQTAQGLWAELAIVAWARHSPTAVAGWHSSANALHDFSAGNDRLEVKSTIRPLREHAFRLEQLSRHGDGRTLVASFMLEESDVGVSINDLVATIVDRTGPGEFVRRLENIVADSLGADWRDAGARRFDLAAARRELRLYAADQLPTISGPIPAAIKDVRFVADLSESVPIDLAAARSVGAFFDAVLPSS